MLACIPTKGNTGLDDTVFDHFGSAPYFTLYDTDSASVTVIENANAHHSHGTCHPMNRLASHRIDCVVCSGMGRRAVEALNAEGIAIYHAHGKTVKEVVETLQSGRLVEMDPARACPGHGQHHSQPHAVLPGQGAGCGRGNTGRGGNGGDQ